MPESPEVQVLAEELDAALTGRTVTDVDVVEFRVTKTRARPLTSIVGETVASVRRLGKLITVGFEGDDAGDLVISFGRHGWARWADGTEAPAAGEEPPPPTLVSIGFDDGRTLELVDAGNFVSLGGWIVDDPYDVPAVAKLGPDPAHDEFSQADFDAATVGRRKQVKAVLQEQESFAGIGNAYSDEILHAAKVSPVVHAAALSDDERARLYRATVDEIRSAIEARRGIPIDQLKAAKVAAMRVHGLAGQPCPRCGGTIRDFTFGSTTAQYCPSCQTGGEILPLREA